MIEKVIDMKIGQFKQVEDIISLQQINSFAGDKNKKAWKLFIEHLFAPPQ